MSCWVVPSIAAEYLGIPLQRVMEQIRTGAVPSKAENGFTFVDVAPESPVLDTPAPPEYTPPPPTYRVVTREEIVALLGDDALADEDDMVGQWRIGRSEASRMRRPPQLVEVEEPMREYPRALAA